MHDLVEEHRIGVVYVSLSIQFWSAAVSLAVVEVHELPRRRLINSRLDLGKVLHQLPLGLSLDEHTCEICPIVNFVLLLVNHFFKFNNLPSKNLQLILRS